MADRTAGIVLAGGRSQRMGTPKAALEWHGSTLLRRAAGLVARAVDGPVVVVCARDQELPPLPANIEVVEDAREDRGPLQAIAAGLAQIGDHAEVVYVSGVDAPLLHPAFVRCVIGSLREEDEIAVPHAYGFAQSLAAAYRMSLAQRLDELIAQDHLATRELLAISRVHELHPDALLADPTLANHDPDFDSLLNLNTREDYAAARARPAPRITLQIAGDAEPRAANAATLAAAAAAATAGGLTLGPQIVATLGGHGTIDDPQEPLSSGDTVTFRVLA